MREERERGMERRRRARARVGGSVIVHGAHGVRGRIVDLSAGGVCFELPEPGTRLHVDERVELAIRLDGRHGAWSGFDGRIDRIDDARRVSVVFGVVDPRLEDVVHDAVLARLQGDRTARVLVVDPSPERRAALAGRLRAVGWRVEEAATPLEVIASLGEPGTRPDLIVVADTAPPSIADELRGYLGRDELSVTLVTDRGPGGAAPPGARRVVGEDLPQLDLDVAHLMGARSGT